MDSEYRNHRAVEKTKECTDANRCNQAEDGCDPASRWTIWRKHQGPAHGGQGVHRPDGQIDPACNDYKGHPYGHDGEETRVLGDLYNRLSIEEFVGRFKGRNLLTCGIGHHSPFSFTVRSRLKLWDLNRATENR